MRSVASVVPWLVAAIPWCAVALAGAPVGHDYQFELIRVAAYAHALLDGQLPPYWAGELYAGYGSPIFLFYGHLYAAVASLLGLALGSWVSAAWLALAVLSALGLWGVQRAAREALGEAGAADPAVTAASGRVAGYVLLLHPYLLGNALLRNANAEYTALCALPLALYGLFLMPRARARGTLWLACGLALVVIAHTLSSLVAVGLIAALALLLDRRRTALRDVALAGALGLGLSSFVWLPALVLKSQVRTGELVTGKFDFHSQFQPLRALFDGSAFHSASPFTGLLLAAALLALLVGRSRLTQAARAIAVGLSVCAAVFVFLQMPVSIAVWEALPVLSFFQFPFRFQGPLAIATALLVAIGFGAWARGRSRRARRLVEAAVIALCVLGALPQLARVESLPPRAAPQIERGLTLQALRARSTSATVRNEYLLFAGEPNLTATAAHVRPALTADPRVRVTPMHDAPRRLELEVKTPVPTTVCLARWAFDFWTLRVDGVDQPIVQAAPGCLVANVPAGTHRVEAVLEPPPLRTLGLALSALAALACALVAARARKQLARPAAI